MIYNDIAYLIQQSFTTDDYGDSIPTEVRRMVYCAKKSVGMKRKLEAESFGLKLAYKFVLADALEYQNEEILEYDGKRYNVVDAFVTEGNEVELTVQRF